MSLRKKNQLACKFFESPMPFLDCALLVAVDFFTVLCLCFKTYHTILYLQLIVHAAHAAHAVITAVEIVMITVIKSFH